MAHLLRVKILPGGTLEFQTTEGTISCGAVTPLLDTVDSPLIMALAAHILTLHTEVDVLKRQVAKLKEKCVDVTSQTVRHEFSPQLLSQQEGVVKCRNCGWNFNLSIPEQLDAAENGNCFPRPTLDTRQLHVVDASSQTQETSGRGQTKAFSHIDTLAYAFLPKASFQERVGKWIEACFGEAIASDLTERNHRFLEESLELVQACGCTASEAHQLVDYVYGRPVGEKSQEAGGVMVTLACLCRAQKLDMDTCGEIELERVWEKIEKIRAKQAAKPSHSPLPEVVVNADRVKFWTECRDMFCIGSVSWTLLNDKIINYTAEGEEFPQKLPPAGCSIDRVWSGVCSHGTRGCIVDHVRYESDVG